MTLTFDSPPLALRRAVPCRAVVDGRGELFGDGGPELSRSLSAQLVGSSLASDPRPAWLVWRRNEELAVIAARFR